MLEIEGKLECQSNRINSGPGKILPALMGGCKGYISY